MKFFEEADLTGSSRSLISELFSSAISSTFANFFSLVRPPVLSGRFCSKLGRFF
jgi:hypothetical protein